VSNDDDFRAWLALNLQRIALTAHVHSLIREKADGMQHGRNCAWDECRFRAPVPLSPGAPPGAKP
jgi:hypothetical protein